jgi:hypothetical protein
MAEPVNVGNASEKQKSNYLEVSLKLEFAINKTIALLKTRKTVHADAEESQLIDIKIGDLEAKRAKIVADRFAFLAEQREIKPPSDSDVAKVTAIVATLDSLVAGETTANALIDLGTDILNIYNKTRA